MKSLSRETQLARNLDDLKKLVNIFKLSTTLTNILNYGRTENSRLGLGRTKLVQNLVKLRPEKGLNPKEIYLLFVTIVGRKDMLDQNVTPSTRTNIEKNSYRKLFPRSRGRSGSGKKN